MAGSLAARPHITHTPPVPLQKKTPFANCSLPERLIVRLWSARNPAQDWVVAPVRETARCVCVCSGLVWFCSTVLHMVSGGRVCISGTPVSAFANVCNDTARVSAVEHNLPRDCMSHKQSTGILHLCNLPGSCIKSQPLQIICWDIYCTSRNACKQFCTKPPVAELSAHPLRCTAVSRALRLLSPPAADIARGQVGLIATVCNAPSEAQASCCNVPVMPPSSPVISQRRSD